MAVLIHGRQQYNITSSLLFGWSGKQDNKTRTLRALHGSINDADAKFMSGSARFYVIANYYY